MIIKTENKNNNIKIDTLLKSIKSWEGQTLPKYPSGQPEITIFRVNIPPKTKLIEHSHPGINMGVITKGELTIINEEGYEEIFKQGEVVVESVNKIHSGENRAETDLEILVFSVGVEGNSLSFYKD
ncbi:MAG: cupin domain-containing protein [Alphaproteobacteria bacterium]|nr:cupin domain-containing protein [Alphaproteobacteria bacterium]